MQVNNKPGARATSATERCPVRDCALACTGDTGERSPEQGVKTLHLAEKAFSRKERARECEAGSALPGPPACQQAGITDLQRMSPRDDRAATLIFSAASAPVSYLCAGMIGIHYRPPPAARWLPGEESASSPSLNGIRLSPGAETQTCANCTVSCCRCGNPQAGL